MSGDVSHSDTWVAERAGPTQWKGRQRAPGGIMIYSRGRGHFAFRCVSAAKSLSGDAFIQLNGTHPSPPLPLLNTTFCRCCGTYRSYSRRSFIESGGYGRFFFFSFFGRILTCCCGTAGLATTFQPWLCSRHVIEFLFTCGVFVCGRKKKMPSLLEMTLLFVTKVKKRNLKCKLCLLSKKGNLSDEFTCQDANC